MGLRSSHKIDAGFNMSSMTDLVFLLLIFFVILSTMVSPYALPVDLPTSANKTKEKAKVAVRIDAEEHYSVNNQLIDPSQLESVLTSEMSKTTGDQAIILHVDQSVPTGITVSVLDICKRNKWKIILATKPS
ncbi:MAG: biopolymer transporter ExbD [Flavobacteriales bacterium]|jgi:biopolymer transport protein ExbD|nr:biopolymer transporter ExbD [Flavobacteriales bacterium]MBK7248791.1 biopolymer transporter ExbD [Flavobacteriales bacterium]MBK9058978.1 biopolymer transporter ExbD [Flavobacteriales bacterium]MBK9599281.1 biopolymer transporter ExbD [Flavobacteriales bacterium]QQS74028.1 MAG: biopolymer transporter ExbD [Flavobacteriales bacterium]